MGGRRANEETSEVGREMKREFYRQLSEVVQKWEEAFAELENDAQRRVVATAAESGLLQAIQMAKLGAKLTSAGWGGCAIALISSDGVAELERITRRRYRELDFKEPAFYWFLPAAGVEVVR